MEMQTILNGTFAALCTAFGWFARELYAATQELRRDLNDLHVELARDYVPVKRFEDAVKSVDMKLDEILRVLGNKEDRK
jgi:hypothetical protein